jgi:hypothetical protein
MIMTVELPPTLTLQQLAVALGARYRLRWIA